MLNRNCWADALGRQSDDWVTSHITELDCGLTACEISEISLEAHGHTRSSSLAAPAAAALPALALLEMLGDDRQLPLRRPAAAGGAPEPEPLTLASGAGGGGPGVPAGPPQQQWWHGLRSTMNPWR